MKIAILGWGSLISDSGDLPLKTEWQMEGPKLPVEFSRVSCSRDGALTLVIDPENGEEISTLFSISKRLKLEDAICDLRARECTVVKHIGYVNLVDGTQRCNVYSTAADIIRKWADEHSFDAVVWTDLPSNFQEETQFSKFSVDNAVYYLHSLTGVAAKKAREYIQKAPAQVTTPLRRNLEHDPWLSE